MGVNRHVFIRGASPKPRPGKAINNLNMNDSIQIKDDKGEYGYNATDQIRAMCLNTYYHNLVSDH